MRESGSFFERASLGGNARQWREQIHFMYPAIAFAILTCVLLIAAASDVRTGKVPNWLTYSAILVGLVYWSIAGLTGSPTGIGAAVVGLLAAMVPFTLIYISGGLGGGDVKLMGAVGAISASWQTVLSTAVYALLVAVVIALVVMVRKGIVKRTLSRLLGAAMQAASKVKPDLPEDSPRIAFSAAIAVGGILAAGEQMLGWQTPWRWLVP